MAKRVALLCLTVILLSVQGCARQPMVRVQAGIESAAQEALRAGWSDWRGAGRLAQADDALEQWVAVEGIRRVHLGAIGRLDLELGEPEGLVIVARPVDMPYLEPVIEDDLLLLGVRGDAIARQIGEVIYRLRVRSIHELQLSGATSAAASRIVGDSLHVRVSGLSQLHLDSVTVSDLTLRASGLSTLKIRTIETERLTADVGGLAILSIENGRASAQQVSLSSAARYRAGDVDSESATVEASGSSRAALRVRQQLSGRVEGSSEVLYLGQPTTDVTIVGSGRVEPRRF